MTSLPSVSSRLSADGDCAVLRAHLRTNMLQLLCRQRIMLLSTCSLGYVRFEFPQPCCQRQTLSSLAFLNMGVHASETAEQ